MSIERLRQALDRFEQCVSQTEAAGPSSDFDLDADRLKRLLESMLLARHLDALAYQLRVEGIGHYTISSAGHEGNVVLGALTRPSDPSLLHYRSAAVHLERARHSAEIDAVTDIALSLVAAADEPLCSGRHKVFGSKALGIIPQTSTIASQLPRALGLAFALERRARLGLEPLHPADALCLVSFGDASLNHSTLQGALNAASLVVHQHLKLPLLLVCEDNQLGISVRTPEDWVELRLRAQPHLSYFTARGWRLDETLAAARTAVDFCRQRRLPAVLHLRCRRLLGHAGSDADNSYRTQEEIREAESLDPVLTTALEAIRAGLLTRAEVLALNREAEERVARAGERARRSAGLADQAAVTLPLVWRADVAPSAPHQTATGAPVTLAQGINQGLLRILQERPEALLFGEDVAKKGGVYGVTKGLLQKAGPARVFNTLLDEQTILGLALGAATLGLLPIPEIQYLAYLHNAEDQLRGEAATLRFFSNGAFDNPMIVRIAGLAYQKGFGGHFHNDNSIAVLRDIPGLFVACPARADDAAALLRAAEELALGQRQVVVIIEPIALYHERDLFEERDGLWLAPGDGEAAMPGRARVYDSSARDLLFITYGNGVRLCLRAARELNRLGRRARTLDLRWLKPLPIDDVARHLAEVGRGLIVDECRRQGNVSEEIWSRLCEVGLGGGLGRITAEDCFVPLGRAAQHVLVSEAEILARARALFELDS